VLLVLGQQLAPLCHNALQQAVLALPGQDVPFVRGAISPQQVASHRPSYINAILIQRAGVLVPGTCLECQRRGLRPFPECRFVRGHFGSACGNCKWRDHGARCNAANMGDEAPDDAPDDAPDGDVEGDNEGNKPPPPAQPAALPWGPPGSVSNPVAV
jgi:hypothetical protein